MSRLQKVIAFILVAIGAFLFYPLQLSLLDASYSTVLEDQSGDVLSAQIAKDGQWRFPLIEELPQSFIDCITVYEDKRYFNHLGVDPIAMMRAIQQNAKAKKVVSGGSTLSMQVMRMSMGNQKRTLPQKLIEAFYALKLEVQYSKDEILKVYAAHAPFGGNVVGLETAAWRYYQKSPATLSWAQMATLCVLPNAPSLIRLDKNTDRLLEKRNYLLDKLYAAEKIDELDWELAKSEDLHYGFYSLPQSAPHLLARAKRDGNQGRIKSTIDGSIQRKVNEILNYHHEILTHKGIHNAAVIVLDTRTQEVVSYAGNIPKTIHEKDVDMIKAHRSSGSILKPFLYASMIEEGVITPHSLQKDVPVFIDGFSPTNYHETFSGLVPASQALSQSLNVPFVLMLQEYGVGKFVKRLRQNGLSTINKDADHYGLSLILGGAEVRLDELTAAYSHMGRQLYSFDKNKGKYDAETYPTAHYIRQDSKSADESEFMDKKTQGFSASSIYHTLSAMENLQRPNGFGDWDLFSSSQRLAWKTGTSYGHRDAWAVGVHSQYTIGVWVGNADGEGRDEIIGVSTAGKLLFDVVDVLSLEDGWWAEPYNDMAQIKVCKLSGMLPTSHCESVSTEWISQSSERTETCQFHASCWVDQSGEYAVHRDCYPSELSQKVSYLSLSPLVAKHYAAHQYGRINRPPVHPDCIKRETAHGDIELVYPNPSERIFIPNDLNAERKSVVAQLEHSNPDTEVYWYLNGDYLGMTKDFHTMSIDASPGSYALLCTDQRGERIERRFEIVGE